MTIGVLKDGEWVFNKACTAPWCHAVVHFEVKMTYGGRHIGAVRVRTQGAMHGTGGAP